MKVVDMIEEQPLMAASSATTPDPQTFGGEFGYMRPHIATSRTGRHKKRCRLTIQAKSTSQLEISMVGTFFYHNQM